MCTQDALNNPGSLFAFISFRECKVVAAKQQKRLGKSYISSQDEKDGRICGDEDTNTQLPIIQETMLFTVLSSLAVDD